jgi:L-fuculose-phosphate aldolase
MRLLNKLVAIARYLGELGCVIGREGNISVRRNDEIYIKASGAYLGMAEEGDFVKVNLDGSYSERKEPSVELPMHLAIYRAREDVKAIIHSHPTYLTTLSILDLPIVPLTTESEIYLKGRLGVVGRLPAGSDGLAKAVERG